MTNDLKDECLIAADRLDELGFTSAANELRKKAMGSLCWLLEPYNDWEPWYDKANGFVVVAMTEEGARLIASSNHGDEGPFVWLDSKVTRCLQILLKGDDRLILRDYAAA